MGEDGKEKPTGDYRLYERELLLAVLNKTDGNPMKIFGHAEHGLYFCVNPLGKTREDRKEANVFDFRHCLIEFDSIPVEHQYQLIMKSRIPCAAITTSGGRSIHAIVKVGARSLAEYRQRVVILMSHFHEYGCDPATKDSVRLSRFPGGKRLDTEVSRPSFISRPGLALSNSGRLSRPPWPRNCPIR
jgi:hypothetical protein